MDPKRLIGVLMLVGVVAAGFILLSGGEPEPEPVEEVEVKEPEPPKVPPVEIVSTRVPLLKGASLRQQDLAVVIIDEDKVGEALRADAYRLQDLEGGIVLRAFAANESLVRKDLFLAEDGNPIRAYMEPGMRAVTFPVNISSSLNALLRPGDRVDVLMRLNESDNEGQRRGLVSRVLLNDTQVLAIGRASVAGEASTAQGGHITLEVSPEEAEALLLGMSLGNLQIVLRNDVVAETSPALSSSPASSPLPAPVERRRVSRATRYLPEPPPPPPPPPPLPRVLRGGAGGG